MMTAAERQRKRRASNPECARAASRKYYRKNREREIARVRAWQAANPEKYKEHIKNRRPPTSEQRREQRLKKLYKMTVAERDAMFEAQGRRCAACGSKTPNAKHWHVDHCHDTGVVRGILCQNCNVGLGHAKHDPDVLHLWLRYLRTASVLY